MSTRDDASLTARERAALASLEAMAAAEDPQLARRLRGSSGLRWLPRLPTIPVWSRRSWWGGPVALVGLVVMLLSVSTSLWPGIVGAVLATAGLRMLVGAIEARWVSDGPLDDAG
jgi:Protein of unknown function (DUF3040)